jgi:hypothetical protein
VLKILNTNVVMAKPASPSGPGSPIAISGAAAGGLTATSVSLISAWEEGTRVSDI